MLNGRIEIAASSRGPLNLSTESCPRTQELRCVEFLRFPFYTHSEVHRTKRIMDYFIVIERHSRYSFGNKWRHRAITLAFAILAIKLFLIG